MIENPERLDDVLGAIGCLGSFDLDYEAERVRNTGLLRTVYGMTPTEAADGAPLIALDRFIHPDDIDDVRRVRRSPITVMGGRRVMRFRIVDVDGQLRWLETHGHVAVDNYGHPTRVRGIIMDVTAPKQAASALPDPLPSLVGLDHLSAELLQAFRRANELGLTDVMTDLKPILTRVVRLLGRRFRHASFN